MHCGILAEHANEGLTTGLHVTGWLVVGSTGFRFGRDHCLAMKSEPCGRQLILLSIGSVEGRIDGLHESLACKLL